MRKFTVVFKKQTIASATASSTAHPESITVEADDVNMGNAGNMPVVIFFAVSPLVPAGPQQAPHGKIIHIVPLENVLHVTSEEFGMKLVQ